MDTAMMFEHATCGKPMRRGTACHLAPGHRGLCSTVAFWCDACSTLRRGRPYVVSGDFGDLAVCFLCLAQSKRDNARERARGYP
jgi:hypothetical protein